MDAAKVRELFPNAEIDSEGFFSRDPSIRLLPDGGFGLHINVCSLAVAHWEAIIYWYQHRQEF